MATDRVFEITPDLQVRCDNHLQSDHNRYVYFKSLTVKGLLICTFGHFPSILWSDLDALKVFKSLLQLATKLLHLFKMVLETMYMYSKIPLITPLWLFQKHAIISLKEPNSKMLKNKVPLIKTVHSKRRHFSRSY